jgi:hypothetical protein
MTMTTKKKLNSFIKTESIMVVGRRWFERTNGNTYHTAEIYVNNEFVHKIDFTYGYGDQYYWNSWSWLKANGYVKGSNFESPRIYCEKNKIKWNAAVSDVKRKKDL